MSYELGSNGPDEIFWDWCDNLIFKIFASWLLFNYFDHCNVRCPQKKLPSSLLVCPTYSNSSDSNNFRSEEIHGSQWVHKTDLRRLQIRTTATIQASLSFSHLLSHLTKLSKANDRQRLHNFNWEAQLGSIFLQNIWSFSAVCTLFAALNTFWQLRVVDSTRGRLCLKSWRSSSCSCCSVFGTPISSRSFSESLKTVRGLSF